MARRTLSILAGFVLLVGSFGWALPLSAAGTAAQAPVAPLDRFLAFLANPNVAYLLFVFGLLGLVAEFVTAGAVFPGVLGAICLILALVGLGQLPTNWGGAVLIAAGIVMFVLDIKVAGWGLTAGGLVAFGLGSLLLFTPFWVVVPGASPVRLHPALIVGTTVGVAAFFVLGLSAAIRAQFRPVAVGRHTLMGKEGTVKQALTPTGIVHVEGEEWSATSTDGRAIAAGARIRVVSADGLTLGVIPTEPPQAVMPDVQ